MTFYVRDEATNAAVRRLAKLKNKTLTETIREAVEKEYQSACKQVSMSQRLKLLAERVAQRPKTGLEADKAFFDELSGDI